ncbi:hypothetical protein SOM70_37560 [Streptomyces salinarius]|uniref:hypothetical protein n=1 Tax=Streptomyces salinarius TaxID=2762598 RepID=UPI0032DFC18A
MSSETLLGLVAAGAALIGAFIGAAGAVLAARYGMQGARYQADAQAAYQHQQWLRQLLQSDYASYLTAVEAIFNPVFEALVHWREGDRDAAYSCFGRVDIEVARRAANVLQVEAPEAVVRAAHALLQHVHRPVEMLEESVSGSHGDPTVELPRPEDYQDEYETRWSTLTNECRRSLHTKP